MQWERTTGYGMKGRRDSGKKHGYTKNHRRGEILRSGHGVMCRWESSFIPCGEVWEMNSPEFWGGVFFGGFRGWNEKMGNLLRISLRTNVRRWLMRGGVFMKIGVILN